MGVGPEEDLFFSHRLHSSVIRSWSADMGAAHCACLGGATGGPTAADDRSWHGTAATSAHMAKTRTELMV